MPEKEKKGANLHVRVSCGCFGCLLELIAFILICYICGCGWARRTVVRIIRDVASASHSIVSDSAQSETAECKN